MITLGLVVGSATVAHAVPAPAQTCAQLQTKLTRLQNLAAHVTDPEARQRLFDQIEVVIAQMEAQGCFGSTARTLSATVRIWTDSGRAPGPYDTSNSFSLRINNLGDVSWSLPPATFPGGIRITQRGSGGSGRYASTGYLSLTTPIQVDTPDGSATGTLDVSTDQVVSTREGVRAGSRVTSPGTKSGNVTLVGNTPLTISVLHLNAQIQLSGTLS
jgi:hypothetical protein